MFLCILFDWINIGSSSVVEMKAKKIYQLLYFINFSNGLACERHFFDTMFFFVFALPVITL